MELNETSLSAHPTPVSVAAAAGASLTPSGQKSLSDTLKPLLLQSTAHGIPRAARGPSLFRRIFWVLVFAVCFFSFIIQTGFLCARYFSFPVNTKLSVQTRKNVTWPAVTVCNLNKFDKSLIDNVPALENINGMVFQSAIDIIYQERGTCHNMYACSDSECTLDLWRCDGYYDCLNKVDEYSVDCCHIIETNYNFSKNEMDATLEDLIFKCRSNSSYCVHKHLTCNGIKDCPMGEDEDVSLCGDGQILDTDSRPWLTAYKHGNREDYSDMQKAGTAAPAIVKANGQKIEDFITQCSFDSLKCDVEDFFTWQNDAYGNCFTFNHPKRPVKTTVREGSQYGLKLALYIDQEDYIGLLSPASGVRVSIHSRNIKPFPEDDGFSVSPGTATSIRIHEKNFVRLGHPYGDCTHNVWPASVKSKSAREYDFSTKSCNKYCFAEYTLAKCGCLSSLILAGDTEGMNASYCTFINETQRECQEDALADYSQGKLTCDCKVPCNEARYQTTLSSARWPESSYLAHFVRMLYHEKGEKIMEFTDHVRETLVNNTFSDEATHEILEEVRENFVKLEIYFDDLSLEQIYEEKQLSVETFLSSIGGSLGLWVGLSIISLVEAFEVAWYFISWWYKKSRRGASGKHTKRSASENALRTRHKSRSCSFDQRTPMQLTTIYPGAFNNNCTIHANGRLETALPGRYQDAEFQSLMPSKAEFSNSSPDSSFSPINDSPNFMANSSSKYSRPSRTPADNKLFTNFM